jgi:hypothetical protein
MNYATRENIHDLLSITGGHPHVMEEVYGLGVVVGASRWMLSSWFRPPNA